MNLDVEWTVLQRCQHGLNHRRYFLGDWSCTLISGGNLLLWVALASLLRHYWGPFGPKGPEKRNDSRMSGFVA